MVSILRKFLNTALYDPALYPNRYLLNRIRNLDRLDPQIDRIVQLDPETVKDIHSISKVGSSLNASTTVFSVLANSAVAVATAAGTTKYMTDNTNRLEEMKTNLAEESSNSLKVELALLKALADESSNSLKVELALLKGQVDDLEAANRLLKGTQIITMCFGVTLVTTLLISLKK